MQIAAGRVRLLTKARRRSGGEVDILEAIERRGDAAFETLCLSEQCLQPVIPVRAHQRADGSAVQAHFRHQATQLGEAGCFGSTSEGVLHYAAKLHLRECLERLVREGGALLVEQPCVRCGRGIAHEVQGFAPEDRVHVEHWLDPRHTLKPDVTVYRGDAALFLFEVRVSHRVTKEKLSALRERGSLMVEMEALTLLGTKHSPPWSPSAPLRVKDAVLPIRQQECPGCQEAERQAHAAHCDRMEAARRARERFADVVPSAASPAPDAFYRTFVGGKADGPPEVLLPTFLPHSFSPPRLVPRFPGQPRLRLPKPLNPNLSFEERLRRRASLAYLSLTWRLVGHLFLDTCVPGGRREALPLVLLEWSDQGETRLTFQDHGELYGWPSWTFRDDEAFIEAARRLLRQRFATPKERRLDFDTYGGMRRGYPDPGALPEPGLLWETAAERWVRAVRRDLLLERHRMSLFDLETRLPPEKVRRARARVEAREGGEDIPVYVPDEGVRLEEYFPAWGSSRSG